MYSLISDCVEATHHHITVLLHTAEWDSMAQLSFMSHLFQKLELDMSHLNNG